MSSTIAQDFLFQRIREMLPQYQSLADTVSEILNLSNDGAYQRISGEIPLGLEEAKLLCDHFRLSLDSMLQIKSNYMLFRNTRISEQNYNYESYLVNLVEQVNHISGFIEKEIYYISKDIPIFHNFYFPPLIAFRYFFWMKTLIGDKNFQKREFELNCVPAPVEELSKQLVREYGKVPCVEIWNTESVNTAIMQIEFYKDSGYFSSSSDIRTIYESLLQTLLHVKDQVEYGCKFMPGDTKKLKHFNYRFFCNRVFIGDNTVLVITDRAKSVFLNYNVLNYITTRDESFCNSCYSDIQNLLKRSTIISQSSEKQRNIFFNILLNKVNERLKNKK